MANVKISDLAFATLPIDTVNTFFELQTIEGGVEVSRKLSAQDLGIGGGVLSVTGGTNINVDNTDPQNPIVNLPGSIVATIVNGVLLSDGGLATDYLDETGAYSSPTNGVTLDTGGPATEYLDRTGNYSTPAGGGVTFPLDAADNDQIRFGTGQDFLMFFDSTNMIMNAVAGAINVQAGGVTKLQFDQANNRLVLTDWTFFMEERAAAEPDSAGFGQLWVRNDTPNVLVFTDDTGVDTVLGAGGGGVNSVTGGSNITNSGTAADPVLDVDDPLIISSINATSSGAVSDTGSPYTNVALNIGANLVGTQGMTQYGRQNIQARPSSFGFNSTLFININGSGTNGANTFIGGLNSASLEVEFGVAVRMQHGLVNTVVAETIDTGILLPAGSCFIDEKAAAETSTAGRGELWVRNDSPNVLVFTDDTGVDNVLGGGFDPTSNQTISGAWVFTNTGGLGLDPSCELDMRNNADNSTMFIQYNGPDLEFGIAGSDFGSAVFQILTTSWERVEAPNIFLGEVASAAADVTAFGQLWVRNDTPNNLMFTDDSGNDFLVAGTGAGGDISAGSNVIAGTSFVAVANVSPEINTDYMVIASVEVTAPAADDMNIQFTIDTNARFYGTLTNTEDDTTQIIEGQLAEVVTNNVLVPTSGSATPAGTYVTIIGRLVMGATTGTMSLRCAKNADTGADGAAIRGAIKLIPIN